MDTPTFAALPFFLNADEGERFCLYHEPEPDVPPRGAILYVQPFAEELNQSRRMVALQARAYAQAGFGVLQIDLYGCGDSSGEFAQASWNLWLDDLSHAWQWLGQRNLGPCYLWGLRLGALLALDFARLVRPAGVILWQPAISGRAYLNQFARMRSAALLFAGGAPAAEQATEIAGYLMSSSLSDTISQLDAALMAPSCPVHWLELNPVPPGGAGEYAAAAGAAPALQPASALLIKRWREDGASVQAHAVHGEPFWTGADAGLCSALLAAITAVVPPERA